MIKRILTLFSTIFVILFALESHATDSVTPAASPITHNATINTAITVTWTIVSSGSNNAASVGTFESLATGGIQLGSTIPTTPNSNTGVCFTGGSGVQCTLSETITIPNDTLAAAVNNGLATIYYKRTYTGGSPTTSAVGVVQINLTYTTPSISVNPSVNSYTVGSTLIIPVTWSISTFGNASGTPTSTVGTFKTSPVANFGIGTIATTINTSNIPVTGTPPAGASTTTENISIPASTLSTLQQASSTTVYYERTFAITTNTIPNPFNVTTTVQINLSYNAPGISATPTATSHVINSGLTIPITWNVSTLGNANGTITSNSGSFSTSANTGNTFGSSVNTTLTTNSPPLGTSGTTPLQETLTIPASILTTAEQNNNHTIYYYRDFTVTAAGTTAPFFVAINLAQVNPQASLEINRLALRFSDNKAVKLVQKNSKVSVLADIKFEGTGLLDAVWEVADPTSTKGTPIYIPYLSVRQYLNIGGQFTLQSPTLPTGRNGIYKARLRIKTPTLSFTQPTITYTVKTDSKEHTTYAIPPVKLYSPRENDFIKQETRFKWYPVKGAKAYQLELYLPDVHKHPKDDEIIDESLLLEKKPATGILVPAKKTSLSLGALSRDTLRHGQSYYWRIIAIGNDGQTLTTSPLRVIRTP